MAEEKYRTKVVPYASDVGSIVCYVVYRTGSVPAMSQWRGTRMIQERIIGQRSKIVLGVNKDMFLDYGGDKEVGVKGYVDARFNTYPDSSE